MMARVLSLTVMARAFSLIMTVRVLSLTAVVRVLSLTIMARAFSLIMMVSPHEHEYGLVRLVILSSTHQLNQAYDTDRSVISSGQIETFPSCPPTDFV